jgi:ABC-type transporter Mla MlaB component
MTTFSQNNRFAMKMWITDTMACLEGSWTLKNLTSGTIDALSDSLDKIEPGNGNCLRIDFHQISEIDGCGQQLLFIWLQCIKFRGIEPELFNVPANLRKTFKKLGFRICKGIKSPDTAKNDFKSPLLRECFCR